MKYLIHENGSLYDRASAVASHTKGEYKGDFSKLSEITDKEAEAKLASLLPNADDIKAASERKWRDQELASADIELLKVQDGDGTGLVSNWRTYRVALRNYPQQAGFPYCERPKFVNSDKE